MKFMNWFKRLTTSTKVLLTSVAVATLFLIGVGASPDHAKPDTASTDQKPSTSQTAPKITTKTETETQSIPFASSTVTNDTMAKGTTKVTTAGINGSKTLTYQVTYKDGMQTNKRLTSTVVTLQPVTQVTSVGTYVAPAPQPKQNSQCDPNYSGACVPIASDVDCAGGSGNGPAYVRGPVYVIGTDIYGLDGDGNGVGCQ